MLRLRMSGTVTGENLRLSDAGRPGVTGTSPGGTAGESLLELPLPTTRRGIWRAPPLRLSTHAPFGLFQCWTWLQLDVGTEVYPQPVGDRPVPESAGDDAGHQQLTAGLEELTWLRSFREGDSPRQVAWKAYARGMPLLVREYRDNAGSLRTFDFGQLVPLAPEQRLCQLCRWVVDTAARGEFFTLMLPAHAPLEGNGPSHREQCLRALARFGEVSAT